MHSAFPQYNLIPVTGDITFYRDLAYVFGGAVVGGAVARVLRQPLILGYVLGGVIVGPFTPGPRVGVDPKIPGWTY